MVMVVTAQGATLANKAALLDGRPTRGMPFITQATSPWLSRHLRQAVRRWLSPRLAPLRSRRVQLSAALPSGTAWATLQARSAVAPASLSAPTVVATEASDANRRSRTNETRKPTQRGTTMDAVPLCAIIIIMCPNVLTAKLVSFTPFGVTKQEWIGQNDTSAKVLET